MVNILSNHVLLFEIHLIKLFSCQRVSFLTQPKIILTATEETLEPEQMQSVPAKDYGTFFSFTTVYNVALLFDLFFSCNLDRAKRPIHSFFLSYGRHCLNSRVARFKVCVFC